MKRASERARMQVARLRSGGVRRAASRVGLMWLLLLVPLSGQAESNQRVPPSASATVIVLSLDGVRHDYLERAPLPSFERMASAGGRAAKHVPVFPSSTFPSHISMATGTYPDRHGIVGNRFRDADGEAFSKRDAARWLEAEPVWIAAERQGVRAATFFWVGSETDWQGKRATYRRTPFDDDIGEDAKVDQILAWLDLPAASRPGLVMSWWHGADGQGHLKGGDHAGIREAMIEQDAALSRLLAGIDARDLWATTTLMVVSDHGMTPTREPIRVEAVLEEAEIPAELVVGTAVVHVYLGNPARDTERTVALLAERADVEADAQGDVPESLRFAAPGRMGDVVARTHPPYYFEDSSLLERGAISLMGLVGWQRSGHGYGPEHPDMAGIFLAMGRGVPAGTRWPQVHSVDLAPTISALLGIDPPRDAEGQRISGIGVAQGTRRPMLQD